jgi:UDP-galactopyranose mutase
VADVVVVGAGLGGLSCAARLAKLGHSVVVCERDQTPGGLLGSIGRDGFRWDASPLQITLPAVLRDLFRKSGRPLERYVDLQLSTPARRHIFEDGSVLDLPTGSRAAQHDAISSVLGRRAAAEWTAFVDDQDGLWQRLRTSVLDVPDGSARLLQPRSAKEVHADQELSRFLRKRLRNRKLRSIATYSARYGGPTPGRVAAHLAVESYVERTFGLWHAPNGASDLARAFKERMSERRVGMRYGCEVVALEAIGEQVAGVRLDDGEMLPAPAVVIARDGVEGQYTHLGLVEAPVVFPREIVLHGDPPVALLTWGQAPAGHCAWTAMPERIGSLDVLDVIAARGLDLSDRVVTRGTTEDGPRPSAPSTLGNALAGVYRLGSDRLMPASWPYVAWEAAHVAARVGRA